MPSALSKDLRWRIVKKSVMHELTANSIADHLDVPAPTVKKVLRRWRETGSVETHQGRRLADAHNTIMTHEQSMRLLELVTLLDDEVMLDEIHEQFCVYAGLELSVSTICRAMHKLGFTRKRLHRLALECDQTRAMRFYIDVTTHHAPSQLLFLDETSKDWRAMNRSYGFALRGQKPRSSNGIFLRGERISTLGAFDMNGFIDWYSVTGTFKHGDFLDGVQAAVLPHITPFPGPRSVVILDNASIHKRDEFSAAVRARGGMVLWLPPYCWHLNPIEEAFGAVRQWLMRNKHMATQLGGTQQFLNAAFDSVTPDTARSCFHHCGY